MTLFGLGLVPCAADIASIVDFRQRAGHLIGGPMLGETTNLPHVSILQCPFDEDALTQSLLDCIAESWSANRNCSPVVGHFGPLLYQPVGWVFGPVLPTLMSTETGPWCADLQRLALERMRSCIDMAQIDVTRDTSQYTTCEREAYLRYGYRYVGDAFRPHVTLGRISGDTSAPAPELLGLYADSLASRCVTFDRLVFYRAGEYGVLAEIVRSISVPFEDSGPSLQ